MPEPVFEKDIEKEFEEKTKRIVQDTIKEQTDLDSKKRVQEKIQKIKETIGGVKEKEEKVVEKVTEQECPTCKGHTLHVHDNIAKCTGATCGKEFLLLERIPKVKKELMCTTCGHTMTKDEAKSLSGKKCPYCNEGDAVIPLDWKEVAEKIKSMKRTPLK